jgi:hypothetical protein
MLFLNAAMQVLLSGIRIAHLCSSLMPHQQVSGVWLLPKECQTKQGN